MRSSAYTQKIRRRNAKSSTFIQGLSIVEFTCGGDALGRHAAGPGVGMPAIFSLRFVAQIGVFAPIAAFMWHFVASHRRL
jgi:hypothetical protein